MARSLLRLLGTRYGIALVLLVVVMAVVGLARTFNGPSDSQTVTVKPVQSAPGSEPSNGLGDDGVTTEEAVPSLSASEGSIASKAVALNFATAWLKRDLTTAAWLQGVRPYSTANLMDLLRDVDPNSVPATAMHGDAAVKIRDESFVEVTIPLSAGALQLTLLNGSGRWLVDAVDWIKQ